MSSQIGMSLKKRIDFWLLGVKEQPVTFSSNEYRQTNICDNTSALGRVACLCERHSNENHTNIIEQVNVQYHLDYRTLIHLSKTNPDAVNFKSDENDCVSKGQYDSINVKLSTNQIYNVHQLIAERLDRQDLFVNLIRLCKQSDIIVDNESIQIYREQIISNYDNSICVVLASSHTDHFAKEILSFNILSLILTGFPAMFYDYRQVGSEKHFVAIQSSVMDTNSSYACIVDFSEDIEYNWKGYKGMTVVLLSSSDNQCPTNIPILHVEQRFSECYFSLTAFHHSLNGDRLSYMCCSVPSQSINVALFSQHIRTPILPIAITTCLMHFVFKNGCSTASLLTAFKLTSNRLSNLPIFFPNSYKIDVNDLTTNGILTYSTKDIVKEYSDNCVLHCVPLLGNLVDQCAFVLCMKNDTCVESASSNSQSNSSLQQKWCDIVRILSLFFPQFNRHWCVESINERWMNVLGWAENYLIVSRCSEADRKRSIGIELQLGDRNEPDIEVKPQFTNDLDFNHNRLMLVLLENLGIELMRKAEHFLGKFEDTCVNCSRLKLAKHWMETDSSEQWHVCLLWRFVSSLVIQGVLKELQPTSGCQVPIYMIDKSNANHLQKMKDISCELAKRRITYLRSLILRKADTQLDSV